MRFGFPMALVLALALIAAPAFAGTMTIEAHPDTVDVDDSVTLTLRYTPEPTEDGDVIFKVSATEVGGYQLITSSTPVSFADNPWESNCPNCGTAAYGMGLEDTGVFWVRAWHDGDTGDDRASGAVKIVIVD